MERIATGMPGQDIQFHNPLSRRTAMKGLAAFALAIIEAGCTSPNSSSTVTATPTATPVRPGSIIYTYKGHSEQILTVAWSSDGKRIVSGSRDTTVQVWDALTGKHAQVYRGHTNGVPAVAWSPDSKYVASASWDKTVQVWNASTAEPIFTYHGHSAQATSVTWSPDGKYIASGSSDKSVQIWNALTGAVLFTYHGHTAGVTVVAWSPDGSRIASGSTDKSVQIRDAASGKLLFSYHGHTDEITGITWSPDSKYIASGSVDKSVQTWDASTGKVLYTYRGYNVAQARSNPSKGVLPDLIYTVAWSHNGKRIAAVTQVYCGDDCGVLLSWDALTEAHFTFYPTAPMYALAWSPDDRYFVTAVSPGGDVSGGMPVVQILQV